MRTWCLHREEGFPSQKTRCQAVPLSVCEVQSVRDLGAAVVLGVRKDRGFPAAAHCPPSSLLCSGCSSPRPPQRCPDGLDLLCCREGASPLPITDAANWGEGVQYRGAEAKLLQHQVFLASSQLATAYPRGALMQFSENGRAQWS